MMAKFLNYLLSIFYTVESHKPISVKAFTEKFPILPKAGIEHSPIKKNKNKKITKTILKDKLTIQIKNNIYYLDNLIDEFREFPEYDSYRYKLEDLKNQSQGCLKILFRMPEDVAYYMTTLKIIYSHTKNISELMDIS